MNKHRIYSFPIFGIETKIIYVDKIPEEVSGMETDGLFSPSEGSIYIVKGTPEEENRRLLHEIFHGIAQYGGGSVLSEDLEEIFACLCEFTYNEFLKKLKENE